jgi:hypothetical protein
VARRPRARALLHGARPRAGPCSTASRTTSTRSSSPDAFPGRGLCPVPTCAIPPGGGGTWNRRSRGRAQT